MKQSDIENITWYSVQRIKIIREQLASCDADDKRKERLAIRECRSCYYFDRGRMAGQAFTEFACQLCHAKAMHGDTVVPKGCWACSDMWHICVRCMGDLHL